MTTAISAKAVYERLVDDRDPYLVRGKKAARLTIPSVLPEDSDSQVGADLPNGYHSIGAKGVNNLASKLTLSLLPPNTKFLRMELDASVFLENPELEKQRAEIEDSLAKIEDLVLDEIEANRFYTKIYEAVRSLIVTGNVLIHVRDGMTPRVFRMDSYVIERDPRGNILTVVTRQKISPLAMDDDLRKKVNGKVEQSVTAGIGGREQWVEIHTMIRRTKDGWEEFQEIQGHRIGPVIKHDKERNPYIPLRMYSVDGESWGRGYVEEYMGDLMALEELSKAILAAQLQASKCIFMRSPSAMSTSKQFMDTRNGGVIDGLPEDFLPIQLNKFADIRGATELVNRILRDLGLVFMLNSTVQRDAERVTAEEIRLVARELEDTLGGIFSQLAMDLSLPMVLNILGNLQDRGDIQPLPSQVKPTIVTGLSAIGRGHDLQNIQQLFGIMQQSFGPDVMQAVDSSKAWKVAGTALGVDVDSFLKSPEELEQERQQIQANAAMQAVGSDVIKQFPEAVSEGVSQASGGRPQLRRVS